MKLKGLFAAAAVLTMASALYANDAGCGLGSMLFKENQPAQQIVAATTNGISGNQTFGITTGTLGCNSGGLLKTAQIQQEKFVTVNFRDLSREMAQGKGEYVSSLAGLLGCSETNVSAFGKFTQDRYSVLFPKQNVAPAAMLKTLKHEMAKDPTLGANCTQL